VLRNVGFEVVEGTNLTRDKMTERLLEFGKKRQAPTSRCSSMPATASPSTAPTICCRRCRHQIGNGRQARRRDNIDLTLDQTMNDAKVKLVFLDGLPLTTPFAAKIKSNFRDPPACRFSRALRK